MKSFRHSVSAWCYSKIPLPQFAATCRDLGIESIELTGPEDWPELSRHGLTCALSQSVDSITESMNRRENHQRLIPAIESRLRECASAGVPNLVCFAGSRNGLSDEEGLTICTEGYRQLTALAEHLNVTLCIELLNSKVDHPDYQCDHTTWGVELCKRVASTHFKLLFDIYHMQIMEGDIIQSIRKYHPYIGHYHTAGNPGRHEIDDTQELNYPAIMRAIKETGFVGFVGQEFIPTGDPITSLREAIRLCTV